MGLRSSIVMAFSVGALAVGGTSQAAIMLFDDTVQNGATRPWWTGTEATNVYRGTTSLGTTNGQVTLNHAGLAVGNNYILEMWVNTRTTTPATPLFIQMDYTDAASGTTKTSIPLDGRNGSRIYNIDGVDRPYSAGISTDGNPATWQKFRIDLTQLAYTGFPYQQHQFNADVDLLKGITFRSENSSSAGLLIDDVQLVSVPEPSVFALAGLGLAGLAGSRRRR